MNIRKVALQERGSVLVLVLVLLAVIAVVGVGLVTMSKNESSSVQTNLEVKSDQYIAEALVDQYLLQIKNSPFWQLALDNITNAENKYYSTDNGSSWSQTAPDPVYDATNIRFTVNGAVYTADIASNDSWFGVSSAYAAADDFDSIPHVVMASHVPGTSDNLKITVLVPDKNISRTEVVKYTSGELVIKGAITEENNFGFTVSSIVADGRNHETDGSLSSDTEKGIVGLYCGGTFTESGLASVGGPVAVPSTSPDAASVVQSAGDIPSSVDAVMGYDVVDYLKNMAVANGRYFNQGTLDLTPGATFPVGPGVTFVELNYTVGGGDDHDGGASPWTPTLVMVDAAGNPSADNSGLLVISSNSGNPTLDVSDASSFRGILVVDNLNLEDVVHGSYVGAVVSLTGNSSGGDGDDHGDGHSDDHGDSHSSSVSSVGDDHGDDHGGGSPGAGTGTVLYSRAAVDEVLYDLYNGDASQDGYGTSLVPLKSQ
ncbi:MAG: hypothetical protein ACE5GM_06185 [bacterium]